jgi:hypothetical protein
MGVLGGVPSTAEQASRAGDWQVASRVRFFSHLSKDILLVDFSGSNNVAMVKAVAAECRRAVMMRPFGSVRTLVNVTGTWFDKETIMVASDLASQNRPYVTRSAVIGVTGLLQIAFNGIVSLTKRNMKLFKSRDEALAWLVADDGKQS